MTPDRFFSYGEPHRCGNRVFIPVYYSAGFYGEGFGYRQIVPWVLLIVEDDMVSFAPLGEEVTAEDLTRVIKDISSPSGPCGE
jgi:hypothetical protein